MDNMTINFNGINYIAKYNKQSGYYEVELEAPEQGGIYQAQATFIDLLGQSYEDTKPIQIWAKEKLNIKSNKTFMWIFDYNDFTVKDIIEISDYELNIDEETNANTTANILKETTAKAGDIVAIKENNEVIYWGTINEIQNENGSLLRQYIIKYITNIFDEKVHLNQSDEEHIKTIGIEDYIAKVINDNFINSLDVFANKRYLEVRVKTHTKLQTSVTNIQDNLYNLHTWLTNCTQLYNINYNFFVENKKLIMEIENKTLNKELIDTKAQAISNYTEVFETNIVSKVEVFTDTETYCLYLLNDRTTTTDINNENRASGRTERTYTAQIEEAPQKALDIIQANKYNHMITFSMFNKEMKIGTPIAIKTKQSLIFDTYISAVKKRAGSKMFDYTCGNIRIELIDKLKQKEIKK